MAAQNGRDFRVLKNGVALAGLRENGVTVDNSAVDITDKNDAGYRTLASFSGVESIDISASGVFKDDTIRDIAFAGTSTSKLITDITIEWGDGATLSGDFYIANFESGGTHEGEETYSCTFQSSGEWTYTASV